MTKMEKLSVVCLEHIWACEKRKGAQIKDARVDYRHSGSCWDIVG